MTHEVQAPEVNVSQKRKARPRASAIPSSLVRQSEIRVNTRIYAIEWLNTKSGLYIAIVSEESVTLWDVNKGVPRYVVSGIDAYSRIIAFAKNSHQFATSGINGDVHVWNTRNGDKQHSLRLHRSRVRALAWNPDGNVLTSGSDDGEVRFWNPKTGEHLHQLQTYCDSILDLAWSPNGKMLAIAGQNEAVRLFGAYRERESRLAIHNDWVRTVAWSPNGVLLASGSDDNTIVVWNVETGRMARRLEGHTNWIYSVSFSHDGKLLISKSGDGTLRVWRTSNWEVVAILDDPTDGAQRNDIYAVPNSCFHGQQDYYASINDKENYVTVWHYNVDELQQSQAVVEMVRYTSAKVVFIGESSVGKSTLARKLVKGDFVSNTPTTHGMQLWSIPAERLFDFGELSSNETRDIYFWDMGGQDEYRLVHSLFLHDATVALILLDPTRGRVAFDEARGWHKRFERQLRGRRGVNLLVGTKRDDLNIRVDASAIASLVTECGARAYLETSAATGKGVLELKEKLSESIDWDSLAKTSRPRLFQLIRDVIAEQQNLGEVVLFYSDLQQLVDIPPGDIYDEDAINAVVQQLAIQGLLVDTAISTGERILVIQASQVERYAGSILILARDNKRGIPVLEEKMVISNRIEFPNIPKSERLPRKQELIVLQCVIEYLLENNVCLRHAGMLVFPALFRSSHISNEASIRHSVSLFYDFSGAVEAVYSSLVVSLALCEQYSVMRLDGERAEFENPGRGVCGIHRSERPGGFAQLELYFGTEVPSTDRQLFISFVEDHLQHQGVDIIEHVEIKCTCGYIHPETTVRQRILKGFIDVGCPHCDRRIIISEGANESRERDPALRGKTWAMKTNVDQQKQKTIKAARNMFSEQEQNPDSQDSAIRILHLSDLHFYDDTDPVAVLQPITSDLRDKRTGLGVDRLDYLVISGDMSNKADPEEFDRARAFAADLISEFGLSAERCLFVPGNHDVNWNEDVYVWKQPRFVRGNSWLQNRSVPQGDGFLVPIDEKYPLRFKNFSAYFYHPLMQQEYPLEFDQQFHSMLFPEHGIQFLSLNSCWEIDEWHPKRASILGGALSRGLRKANEQVFQAKQTNMLSFDQPLLRIAIWHHAVTGNEKIFDDAFLSQLQRADFKLCLHGDVHELRNDMVGFLSPQKMYVAGTGSLSGGASTRPESTPRLYNYIEVTRANSKLRVHTRNQMKPNGAFTGYAVYPSDAQHTQQSFYEINY